MNKNGFVSDYMIYLIQELQITEDQITGVTLGQFSESHVHMKVSTESITVDEILKRVIAKIYTESFLVDKFHEMIPSFAVEIEAWINDPSQKKRIFLEKNSILDIYNLIMEQKQIYDFIINLIEDNHRSLKLMSIDLILVIGKKQLQNNK